MTNMPLYEYRRTIVTSLKTTRIKTFDDRFYPRVVRCSQGCKGNYSVEAQESSLCFLVEVCLLKNREMVGKFSISVPSSNSRCVHLSVVV